MSASKARLAADNARLQRELAECQRQVVVLLRYITEEQDRNPGHVWPELMERFTEGTWRAVL